MDESSASIPVSSGTLTYGAIGTRSDSSAALVCAGAAATDSTLGDSIAGVAATTINWSEVLATIVCADAGVKRFVEVASDTWVAVVTVGVDDSIELDTGLTVVRDDNGSAGSCDDEQACQGTSEMDCGSMIWLCPTAATGIELAAASSTCAGASGRTSACELITDASAWGTSLMGGATASADGRVGKAGGEPETAIRLVPAPG